MSNDTKFIDGLLIKAPHAKAPEYVKAKLSIKRAELIAWLKNQTGEWINADIKVSQGGKWYAAVEDWKPESERQQQRPRGGGGQTPPSRGDDFVDDSLDIPF